MARRMSLSSAPDPLLSGKTFMARIWAAGAAPRNRTAPSPSRAYPAARAAMWVPWLSSVHTSSSPP